MQPALCSVSYSSSYHHLSAEGRLRSCRIQNFAAGSWLSRELRVLLGQVICFFLGHTWPQFCVRGTTGPNLAISNILPSWFCVLLFFIFWQKADQGNGKCQSYRSQVIGNRGGTPDRAACFLGGSPGQVKSSYCSRHKYKKALLLVPGSGSSGECAVDPSSSRRSRQKAPRTN